jgi:ABC-type multidrug transport system fused ATPase/permease subunit
VKIPLRDYAQLLGTYLRPLWRPVSALGLVLLAGLGLELLNPQIVRVFIDAAQAGTPLASLLRLAGLFLISALVLQAVRVAETYLAAHVGLLATNRLRADLALHVLSLDMAFHNARTPGELIERVDGDVARLGNFFSRFVINLLGNALLLAALLILFFLLDWRVGLAMTGMAALSITVIISLRDVAVPFWEKARQASAALFGFLEERLATTEDLRANGATAYVLRRLYERSRELLQRQRAAMLVGMVPSAVMTALFAVAMAVGLGVGAYLFQRGEMTLGGVYLIFSYSQLLSRPIEEISRQMSELQQAGASLARIQALRAERSQIVDGTRSLPSGALPIEFDHVGFGYPDGDPLLHDITFRLAPGEVLGLLGRTGSGKTTLTRLLFRLYDPTHGVIQLGGTDLRAARLAEVRQKVGIVTQDIQLFHAPVRDNLTFFDRSLSDDRILAVLEELGLWAWYQSLPHGLDTRLAAAGGGLSAGQAQLLAFARVFLKDPAVVVLDEASSRLDPATEQHLERAIDRLLRGRTVIIIAHRLATVQRAGRIMILQAGRVLEQGPREALAADPYSRFAELLRVGLDTSGVLA